MERKLIDFVMITIWLIYLTSRCPFVLPATQKFYGRLHFSRYVHTTTLCLFATFISQTLYGYSVLMCIIIYHTVIIVTVCGRTWRKFSWTHKRWRASIWWVPYGLCHNIRNFFATFLLLYWQLFGVDFERTSIHPQPRSNPLRSLTRFYNGNWRWNHKNW